MTTKHKASKPLLRQSEKFARLALAAAERGDRDTAVRYSIRSRSLLEEAMGGEPDPAKWPLDKQMPTANGVAA